MINSSTFPTLSDLGGDCTSQKLLYSIKLRKLGFLAASGFTHIHLPDWKEKSECWGERQPERRMLNKEPKRWQGNEDLAFPNSSSNQSLNPLISGPFADCLLKSINSILALSNSGSQERETQHVKADYTSHFNNHKIISNGSPWTSSFTTGLNHTNWA